MEDPVSSKLGQAGWKMAKMFWCEHACLIGRQDYIKRGFHMFLKTIRDVQRVTKGFHFPLALPI